MRVVRRTGLPGLVHLIPRFLSGSDLMETERNAQVRWGLSCRDGEKRLPGNWWAFRFVFCPNSN